MVFGNNFNDTGFCGFPPGYSLGGFNSMGGGVDVFALLFQKTLWECSGQPNIPFCPSTSIFMGGCMPSPYGGVSFSNNTDSTSTSAKTTEEKVAQKQFEYKHNALHGLLTDYLATFSDKTLPEYIRLNENLKKWKSVKQENYDDLKGYYIANKANIKAALEKTDSFSKAGVESDKSKMTTTAADLKKQMADPNNTTYSSVLSGESLREDVNVLDLLSSLNKENKDWVDLYRSAFKSSNNGKDTAQESKNKSLNVLYKAIGNALKGKVEALKNKDALSETTKNALNKLLSANNADANKSFGYTNRLVLGMYYWLRIAEAEIMDNKYKTLNSDFSDDDLLGEGSFVKAAKADLQKEGFGPDGSAAKQIFE